MTKSRAKPKAREAESSEVFIVKSGSHSRTENGVRVKFECGDEIELSAAELEQFPLKFISLSEYEGLIAEDERQRRANRALAHAQFPPRVLKRGTRTAEAHKRQRRLLKMQHGRQRRTYVS